MAHLFDVEVANTAELAEQLAESGASLSQYSVAVEGLIFNDGGDWILMERGGGARDEVGKLEGVGGRVESGGRFRDELLREIREEVGSGANIEILGFLEVKSDRATKVTEAGPVVRDWIIVSYVCRHVGGELEITEPEKNTGFVYVSNLDVEESRLSSSCQQSYRTLRERWDAVQTLLGQ